MLDIIPGKVIAQLTTVAEDRTKNARRKFMNGDRKHMLFLLFLLLIWRSTHR